MNSSIIGSNKERKSKIDFELVDKINEEYKNVKKESTPEKTITPLESKMQEYYENGMPKIKPIELENIVVHTPTQKDYDTLMQVYECAGWKGKYTDNEPTSYDCWIAHKEKSGIEIKKLFYYGDIERYKRENYRVIPLSTLCDWQAIYEDKIKEINQWFDKNKPLRISKG